MRRAARGWRAQRRRQAWGRRAFLAACVLALTAPIAWTVLASFEIKPEGRPWPPQWTLPPSADRYTEVMTRIPSFPRVFGTSVLLASGATVLTTAAAFLAPHQNLKPLPFDQKPYWGLERARIGETRTVPVEVVLNGYAAARQEIVADGKARALQFDVPIRQSSWVAVRILPSSHTNPIFVVVDGKPIRASRRSADWCLAAVNQCWTQKAPKISASELPEAKQAYDHARETYEKLIEECKAD